MAKLKTYNEFVNEAIADVIKTPVKYVKIKNNLKKFQKAKVAQALNDVDFAKRKAKGAGDLSAKQKEVLVQANKAKNAALADTTAAVSQRMKDLATTPILQKVVTVGTTKSRMAANKIALKSATGEEAKQLKIKATELSKKASKATGELKDYESTAAKKAEKPAVQEMPEDKAKEQISALRDQRKPLIDSASSEKDPAKNAAIRVKIEEINVKIADLEGEGQAEAKEDLAAAKEKLTKATGGGKKLSAAEEKKAEQKQKLGDQIGKAMQAIEKAKAEGKSEEAEKAKAVEKLNSVKGTEEEGAASKAVAAFATAKKSREDAIKKLQDNIKDLQKQQKELNESVEPESFEYVAESVSEKFARLRPNL